MFGLTPTHVFVTKPKLLFDTPALSKPHTSPTTSQHSPPTPSNTQKIYNLNGYFNCGCSTLFEKHNHGSTNPCGLTVFTARTWELAKALTSQVSLLQPPRALLQVPGDYYNRCHVKAPYLVITTTSELGTTATAQLVSK